MNQAGIEPDQLATLVQVDEKTVGRWLAGRTPHPRYRQRVANTLGTSTHEIWPDTDQPVTPADQDLGRELIAAYPRADDPDAPDWRTLLEAATEQIDLLDQTLTDLIGEAGVVDLLAGKAQDGCRIRILTASPDSGHLYLTEAENHPELIALDTPQLARDVERIQQLLQPLAEHPRVQVRTFVATPYNSIVRADQEMLVTLHLYATPADQAPLLHLRRQNDNGLFERFAGHHQAVWDLADPAPGKHA